MSWPVSIRARCRSSRCVSLADSAWRRRPRSSKCRPPPCGATGASPGSGFIANSAAERAMDSDQWKQLDNLLHDVLQRPPEEREAFLRQACADDEPLAREALSLLAVEQSAAGFLEKPAIELAGQMAVREQNHDPQENSAFRAGAILAHYRVLEKLGGG